MTEENRDDISEGGADPQNGADSAQDANGATSTEEDFTAFEDEFGDGSELLKARAELDQAQEELARARAETYNVRQEYSNYVRRTREDIAKRKEGAQEEVVELLLPVLDDIEAARAAGELEGGPFAAIADKLEDILSARFGLERFGQAGDVFDPMRHDAVMANVNPNVEETVVSQVLQPGFQVGEKVLRPTKVIVDNPA